MKEKLQQEFKRVVGREAQGVYFAPGRVNLIGEHTDYNGGHVFPCALTIGTYAAAAKNTDNMLRFYSMNFEEKGVIVADLADVARELFGFDVDFVEIAKLSQKAENEFIGVNCGIMDQFSIAMGKEGHAIFLDTAALSYEYAPIALKDAKIVIASSNKKRVYENQRTIKAVAALMANDIEEFGKLMIASHESLRDDYEVTGTELDTLVSAALSQEGVIGSRMTGAGFGGCTVSIVRTGAVDAFIKNVGGIYKDKIGYAADFYVVDAGCGPHTL